ncbi:MAG: hypothetical protein Q7J07_10095 [Pelolinea sp.]|nr:hypothetical protein [Pelolinea sp.]
MRNSKYLQIIAVIILLVGIGSSIYVNSERIDSTHIIVNGDEFTIDQLFNIAKEKSIEAESGIALDNLIEEIGMTNPEMFEYTIIGADGYQKTVNWENMRNGILTRNRESIFSDLPKAFRVKEIVVIKVE